MRGFPDGGRHWGGLRLLDSDRPPMNTVVFGPGGYRFSDYPRLGLPQSFIIILVSVPALLYVWLVR
ncbi:hypothetical protein QO004_000747 [Rhizobium mesoamericanum]|uniref:hypothetical protein n=1 Tax=Rhizobium mesoamericanum TaxID=1079800 RepID=UPI00277D6831|nr:hypothetical protein [Rhizobium mesoamericanum]MDQ0558972.1 hypothetical protein [Rhizobium mesoamericanum]